MGKLRAGHVPMGHVRQLQSGKDDRRVLKIGL